MSHCAPDGLGLCEKLWRWHHPSTYLPCRQTDVGQGPMGEWFCTSLSKHFITIGVSATGLKSFRLQREGILGIGIMVDVFRQEGVAAWARDRLKILVNTVESWSAHSFSSFPGTLSGPVAFLGFTDLNTCLMSCSCPVNGKELEAGGDRTSGVGLFASKRAKKQFSSSASEASVLGGVELLPL